MSTTSTYAEAIASAVCSINSQGNPYSSPIAVASGTVIEDQASGLRWAFSVGPLAWLDWAELHTERGANGVLMLHQGKLLVSGFGLLTRRGAAVHAEWFTIEVDPDYGICPGSPVSEISLKGNPDTRPRKVVCPNGVTVFMQLDVGEAGYLNPPCEKRDCEVCGPERIRATQARLLLRLPEGCHLTRTADNPDTMSKRLRRAGISYVGIDQADGTTAYLMDGPIPGSEWRDDVLSTVAELMANEPEATKGKRTARLKWCGAWKVEKQPTEERDFVPFRLASRHPDVVIKRLREAGHHSHRFATPEAYTAEWAEALLPLGLAETEADLRPKMVPPKPIDTDYVEPLRRAG